MTGDNVNGLGHKVDDFKGAYAIFAIPHATPQYFGVIEKNANDTLQRIVEKPDEPATNLISTGSMILSPGIFDMTLVLDERRKEYFIPTLLMQVMATEPIAVLTQDFWVAVDKPEDYRMRKPSC